MEADRLHGYVTLYCSDCGYKYEAMLKCSDRTCAFCRRRTYQKYLHGYKEDLKKRCETRNALAKHLYLMTLTVPNVPVNNPDGLREAIKRLNDSFSRIRRWKAYKDKIEGGIRCIEITCKDDHTWNVHAHILYYGRGIYTECKPLINAFANARGLRSSSLVREEWDGGRCLKCKAGQCLRRDWLKVTGDAFIVDVRRAQSPIEGLRYILKYFLKEPRICGRRVEYNQALKGLRLVQPFGIWYDMKLKKHHLSCPDCGCWAWTDEFIMMKWVKYDGFT